jgi:uncharacterized protein YjiK
MALSDNILGLFLIMLSLACTPPAERQVPDQPVSAAFPYTISSPARVMSLAPELTEISGITWLKEQTLAAVQDELGTVFVLSAATGEIQGRYSVGGPGDYEDIAALSEHRVLILRSDGTLLEAELRDPSQPARAYPSAFPGKYDMEGLHWEAATKTLLIACKDDPVAPADQRRVYSLADYTSAQAPAYQYVSLTEIQHMLQDSARTPKEQERASKFFDDPEDAFQPSGIARHPISGDLYLIAARGSLLVVVSPDYRLLAVRHLAGKTFPQPEGICFDPKGNLYISSEGKDGPGLLLFFPYTPPQ